MADETWPQAKIDRLRHLWEVENLSTREIGEAMGISKNAVVGKAHRLGLMARPSPIKRDGSGRRRARRCIDGQRLKPGPKPKVTLAALVSVPVVVAPVAANPHPAPLPQVAEAVALATAFVPRVVASPPQKLCCWPMWGRQERPTHRYCGAELDGQGGPIGRGYCTVHRARSFTPVIKSGQVAA